MWNITEEPGSRHKQQNLFLRDHSQLLKRGQTGDPGDWGNFRLFLGVGVETEG